MLNDNHNYKLNIMYRLCIGYACRADKNPYRHDGRADKNPYRHDRRADSQCRNLHMEILAEVIRTTDSQTS